MKKIKIGKLPPDDCSGTPGGEALAREAWEQAILAKLPKGAKIVRIDDMTESTTTKTRTYRSIGGNPSVGSYSRVARWAVVWYNPPRAATRGVSSRIFSPHP